MQIDANLSEEAVIRELGDRLAAVRVAQNLTQAALAQQAGISKSTITRLETGAVATQLSAFVRVCRVLGLAGRLDMLVPPPIPGPIEQLNAQRKTRKRASRQRAASRSSRKWSWGESS